MPRKRKKSKENEEELQKKDIEEVESLAEEIKAKKNEIEEQRNKKCYLFLGNDITRPIVGDVFDDLRRNYLECNGKLDIILDSGGGDIDAAFNLSALFRRFGKEELVFLVPRWAKSAATLLACGGDRILMTPIAELGPLDPVIIQVNPFENRLEEFSPLHIESTLDLIRDEFKKGNRDLAEKLIERLQFPLTLGGFLKSLEIGEQYLIKLLSSRMLEDSAERAKTVAGKLTKGYASHGYCINFDEAREIGLVVDELDGYEMDLVWEVYKLHNKKREIEKKVREGEVMKKIKELPPELLETLPKLPGG